MTYDPNDPRLTAFVLGELDPEETAAVETMLGESADCRQAVEEIRLDRRLAHQPASRRKRAHASSRPRSIIERSTWRSRRRPLAANPSWWRKNRLGYVGIAGFAAACRLDRGSHACAATASRLCKRFHHARLC